MLKVKIMHISDKLIHEGDVEWVGFPGLLGDFEVSEGHIPVVSLLSRGRITIRLTAKHKDTRELTAAEKDKAEYKRVLIEQGIMRFDGKEMYAMVE